MSNLNNQINQIGQQLRAESAENALTLARSDLHNERMRNISKSRSSSGDLGDALRIAELEGQIKDKDNMILEWMHSNEAFKRLAKQYGSRLGISDEQRIADFRANVVDLSEENPDFSKTKTGERIKSMKKA